MCGKPLTPSTKLLAMSYPFLSRLQERASQRKRRIILPESTEPRTLQAAVEVQKRGIAEPLFIGESELIAKVARDAGLPRDPLNQIESVSVNDHVRLASFGRRYHELMRHKGISEDEAREQVKDPLFYAAMMVLTNEADGYVAGALNTTRQVLKSAIRIIGPHPSVQRVSSFFLMSLPEKQGEYIFADCAVIPEPNANQLVEIAQLAGANARLFLETEPKVALLSFSTMGSASHPNVKKVSEAAKTLKIRSPDLKSDGELQADAALVAKVGSRKAPGSQVAGYANTLIFPDLNSGNIACKLVERFSGARAIGPILQGLAAPANDLSRGCTVEDIVNVIATTSIQIDGKA